MKNTFYGLFCEERSNKNEDWDEADVTPIDCYKTLRDVRVARKALTEGIKGNPLKRYVVSREVVLGKW